MNKIACFLILSLTILITSCNDDDNDGTKIVSEKIKINHFQIGSLSPELKPHKLILFEDDFSSEEWQTLFYEIEGFEYEMGYIYTLAVDKIKIENPSAQSFQKEFKFKLKEIISKDKVNTNLEFRIQLQENKTTYLTGDNTKYNIAYDINIDCNVMCDELSEITFPEILNNPNVNKWGIFTHSELKNTLKLIRIETENIVNTI